MQAEPVTQEARSHAHKTNTDDIEQYKQKDFEAATRLFAEALEFSPRHPGIILKYVQSSLLLMGRSRLTVSQLDRSLDIVNHYQFERYTNIRDKVIALNTKVNHEQSS